MNGSIFRFIFFLNFLSSFIILFNSPLAMLFGSIVMNVFLKVLILKMAEPAHVGEDTGLRLLGLLSGS